MKICTKCNVPKIVTEFNFLHPAKKDGKLRPDCKQCVHKRQAKRAVGIKNYRETLEQIKITAIKKGKLWLSCSENRRGSSEVRNSLC